MIYLRFNEKPHACGDVRGDLRTRPEEPARWLFHMFQMDFRKHIAIFNFAIDILEGHRIGEPDRQEISVVLDKHLELEKESIE